MKGRLRQALVLCALAGVALAASGSATAGSASLSCGSPSVEHPFAPWLDPFAYVLAEGGALESTAGWRLSGGARLVEENEPFRVHSASDRFSLLLPPGSSATSPWTCIGLDRPTIRFFAASSGSVLGALNVQALFRLRDGRVVALPVLPVAALGHRSWAPTLPLPILVDNILADVLRLDLATTQVSFRFTPLNGLLVRSTWKIDDLYIDPWVNL